MSGATNQARMQQTAPCQGISRPLWQFSSQHRAFNEPAIDLFEQTSFRNHNHVARAKPYVAFEISPRFVSLVVEHEDRFVTASGAAPHLNALFGGEWANASGQRDRLHQGRRLPDHVGPGADNFTRDENFWLEVFFRNVFGGAQHRNG